MAEQEPQDLVSIHRADHAIVRRDRVILRQPVAQPAHLADE
jgi:hypothetical protein